MYRIPANTFCAVAITLLFVVFLFSNTYNRLSIDVVHERRRTTHAHVATEKPAGERYANMKYILLWTNPHDSPFVYFGEGQEVFITKKCKWRNCYVSGDRSLLGGYTEFDVVAFNGPQLNTALAYGDLPTWRTKHQKYVYANIEAASTYPVCDGVWNGFFNWTWTYKLNSDSIWRYFVIIDKQGDIIGPGEHVNWIKLTAMDPIDENLKIKLGNKIKAAAWFVSNCETLSRREQFVSEVQKYLARYNLRVDVYGECGTMQCPKKIMSRCLRMLERDYYFYFAFENSFSEDYVTEKILYALNHNTVPIVYGGANYTRFMPPGIYLNARQLGAAGLAERMFELMHSPPEYQHMFRWKNHYSFEHTHSQADYDVYCQFCRALNSPEINITTVYNQFDSWWTPKGSCHDDKQ